jgi:hypothetical protein
MGIGLGACEPVQAGSANAGLAVSVTVADQCLIRTDSRSASCVGGSGYVLGVGREQIAIIGDRLTTADEHVRTARSDPYLGASRSAAGAAGQQDIVLASGAVRTIAQTVSPIDAIRVTYSF